jgi:serine/threonine-protein kinase
MPQANQRIGEYVLLQPIGRGAFGEVWLAGHHAWSDRQVAIKFPVDVSIVRALEKEAKLVARLSHPGITRAINFDPYADPPYLVVEYVPGSSLRKLISAGPLRLEDALAILRQVLSALGHAHARGVVHRDVKPENILIHRKAREVGFDHAGVVKLTDFGMGVAETRGNASQSMQFSVLSQAGGKELAGTLAYMAPEQREYMQADARSDLWACGVILFEMLVGRRPEGIEYPSHSQSDVPEWIDSVYARACGPLRHRYANAEEFLADLAPPAVLPMSSGVAASAHGGAYYVDASQSTMMHGSPETTPSAPAQPPPIRPIDQLGAAVLAAPVRRKRYLSNKTVDVLLKVGSAVAVLLATLFAITLIREVKRGAAEEPSQYYGSPETTTDSEASN